MPAPKLRDWLPSQNLRDDAAAGGALTSLVDGVLQPVLDEMWSDADRFGRQNDPDLADANSVGAMLLDLGCPFKEALALPLNQQRALVRALLGAYKQFGTGPGLIAMVRALTGVEILEIVSPAVIHGWVLGVSLLGNTGLEPVDPSTTNWTILANASSNAYSFQIKVAGPITAEQEALIREIVRGVKPAHTHFYGFVSTTPPPPQWELDVSFLGGDSYLG
jgi:phage tail-like protein